MSRLALLSPLVLPTVVVAISIYGVYISLRLVGALVTAAALAFSRSHAPVRGR